MGADLQTRRPTSVPVRIKYSLQAEKKKIHKSFESGIPFFPNLINIANGPEVSHTENPRRLMKESENLDGNGFLVYEKKDGL